MTTGPLARAWHGLTAAVALVAVVMAVLQGGVQAPADYAAFHTQAARDANVLVYFTVQSNLIVAVTTLLLALRPRRSALLFRVFRFDGVAMIVLTAVVYHTMLAGAQLHGWVFASNLLLHTVVPAMAVAGWLVLGPRGLVTWRVVWLSLVYPIAWLVVTLVRGAVIGWYPYPFMDPGEQGTAAVALTLAGIVGAFIGLAALLLVVDRALGRLRWRAAAPQPGSSVAEDDLEKLSGGMAIEQDDISAEWWG